MTGDFAGAIRQQSRFDNPLELFSSASSSWRTSLANELNHLAVIAFSPRGFESFNRLDGLGNDLGFDRLRRRVLKYRVARFELERP